jgi:hypothetical protein
VQGRSNPIRANVRIQDSEGSARAGTVRAEGVGNCGCLRKGQDAANAKCMWFSIKACYPGMNAC